MQNSGQVVSEDVKYSDGKNGIVIDSKNKKIVIITPTDSRVYDYADLTGVKVEIDGNQGASANLTGAAVGGIIFGGAGAIVGAMTKSKAFKTIKLKLYFSDIKKPNCHIYFLNKISKTSIVYPVVKNAFKEVDEWYGRMSSIISDNKIGNISQSTSIGDEIKKISALKDQGIISEEEFLNAKSRILSSTLSS